MNTYAKNTSVSSEASRAEIERTLARYGADSFAYGWTKDRAVIGFEMSGRQLRFTLPMPNRQDRRFTHTPARGVERSASAAAAEYDKAVRQQWRALALAIKAKLASVESGIVTFEAEFLAHFVLPGGSTVGDAVIPQMDEALESGTMPRLELE